MRGHGPGEKPKNFKGTWSKIIIYCKKYLPAVVMALVLAMAGAICALIGPDKLKELTNIIAEGMGTGIDMDGVKRIAFTLVGLYGISSLFSYIQSFTMATVTQSVTKSFAETSQRKSIKYRLVILTEPASVTC